MVKLTFHGAAQTVTGSKYLLEASGTRILVDCGLFQGLKELRLKNWDSLPFDPAGVEAVVLTHAHIDHIGYLPRLVRMGFAGPVFSTGATEDLAEILLFDAAEIQEGDAEYANRKGFSKHHPALPLFETRDAAAALRRFRTVNSKNWHQAAGPFWFRFHDAGHLLGSSIIEMEVRGEGEPLRITFSGDVGRYDAPLYHDPTPPPDCDFLVCESTYGDRDHPHVDLLEQLADAVMAGVRRGGVILIPSFAVGRAQQLIYLLRLLIDRDWIPELPIFLDSPMAIDATNIFCDHAAEHDLSEGELTGSPHVLKGRNVHLARTVAESRRINDAPGPAVIIASSGMMTGGRILHHLRHRLPDDRNTVLLGGFMAAGTRGRKLKDGAKFLRMHGQDVPVRAHVTTIGGLSGHADRTELLRWLQPLADPRRVFVTHGEKESAEAFAALLKEQRGWNAHVPRLGETVELRTDG